MGVVTLDPPRSTPPQPSHRVAGASITDFILSSVAPHVEKRRGSFLFTTQYLNQKFESALAKSFVLNDAVLHNLNPFDTMIPFDTVDRVTPADEPRVG